MSEKRYRRIVPYKNYFYDFFRELSQPVKDKYGYVLRYIEVEKIIPKTFFKHIENEDGLYEIRVEVGNNIYRTFCCLDEGCVVILFNSFQKKSQKTPKTQINKARKLKKDYFNCK
jgi:phage-related protein